MLRRVLKSKRADRVLWVTLFLLTLVGVGVALKLSLNAEKRARWIGAENPDSGLEDNPLVARDPRTDSLPAPPAAASNGSTRAVSPKLDANPKKPVTPAPRPLVVQQLTTPRDLNVAAMTPACRSAIEARGPWRDDRAARPWPECQDTGGKAMVLQLCAYARLTTGEWVLSENSARIPRCRAELPLVRAGRVRPGVRR